MTDETRPSNTSRRKWRIAGFLLLILSVAAWWDWPRGDARFVGDWDLIDDNRNQHLGQLALHSNGGGSSTSGSCKRFFSWNADDRHLSFSSMVEFVPAGERIDQLTWELRSGGGNRPAFEVTQINDDAIELQLPGTNRMRTLRRRPEGHLTQRP